MSPRRPPAPRLGPLFRAALYTAAALLALVSVGDMLRNGFAGRETAFVFFVFIAFGELLRLPDCLPEERDPAPVGAAGALAYALLAPAAVTQVVAVVAVATLVGRIPHIARPRPGGRTTGDHLARRVLAVGFIAVCCRPLTAPAPDAPGPGPGHVLLVIVVLLLSALCDSVAGAVLVHSRTGRTFGPALREELRGTTRMSSVTGSSGTVIAFAVDAVGLSALPVFCVPLLLVQLAFRRYAAVRTTCRQTIVSLARATEVAGYTPHGHAHRVAALSLAVGRDMGLTGSDLTVLEYAALMHDIGQLGLVDPVPGGATARLSAAEQRRMALLGGAVVRQTGVDPRVAAVVEAQAEPWTRQPPAARIVRAANAYEEMARRAPDAAARLRALEELRLGTAGTYAPDVVESLARVLLRDPAGVAVPGPGAAAKQGTARSEAAPGWVTHG
ncbi:HD-GYP domain-containing protein [Streptomyces abyssomicinicus]|uniref:HD-GYP domain-containing protein n=1 Tax=Streptomyces abyssomicinicus TaxID=574929 RepID=UPI001FE64C31|nr:HD domain-containing protein [Streptomyces abyssomicinicus]